MARRGHCECDPSLAPVPDIQRVRLVRDGVARFSDNGRRCSRLWPRCRAAKKPQTCASALRALSGRSAVTGREPGLPSWPAPLAHGDARAAGIEYERLADRALAPARGPCLQEEAAAGGVTHQPGACGALAGVLTTARRLAWPDRRPQRVPSGGHGSPPLHWPRDRADRRPQRGGGEKYERGSARFTGQCRRPLPAATRGRGLAVARRSSQARRRIASRARRSARPNARRASRLRLEPIPLGHRQPVTEPPREPIGIGS
jgi:hypothetical protein